jgi:hypothetical protein
MKAISLFVCIISINSLLGQELIGTSGGDDYSIGEVVTSTISGNSVMVTQGFQQPNLFGIGNRKKSHLKIQVFPNPTTDKVQVLFGKYDSLDYLIMNSEGKMILSGRIVNGSEISLHNLPAGQYYLNLQKGQYQSNHTITLIR